MIDVVRALELFEMCADEITAEETKGDCDVGGAARRRSTFTARALTKGQPDRAGAAHQGFHGRELEVENAIVLVGGPMEICRNRTASGHGSEIVVRQPVASVVASLDTSNTTTTQEGACDEGAHP